MACSEEIDDVFRLQRMMRDDVTGQRVRMRRAKAEPYFLPCRPHQKMSKNPHKQSLLQSHSVRLAVDTGLHHDAADTGV
jgi:hypothetical protein